MKSYKEYDKKHLGGSDIASLTVRMPNETAILDFGEDGDYRAYIVDEDAVIGEHYREVLTAHNWIWIFDDFGKRTEVVSPTIKIYRSGSFGVVIQTLR